MRNIVSVIRRIPEHARRDYLEAVDALAKRSGAPVKGFYLVESEDAPGVFQEFWEYDDRNAADAHRSARTTDAATLRLLERIDRLAPGSATEVSHWRQRL
jgi:hypothetical protein